MLVSVKLTARGAGPLVALAVNDAVGLTGAELTEIVFDVELEPPLFVAVNVAVKVPAAV